MFRLCAVSASRGTHQWRRTKRLPPRTQQSGSAATVEGTLTINVLLILQVRDIFFFLREKHIMGLFEGFLRPFWGQKSRELLKNPEKRPH